MVGLEDAYLEAFAWLMARGSEPPRPFLVEPATYDLAVAHGYLRENDPGWKRHQSNPIPNGMRTEHRET